MLLVLGPERGATCEEWQVADLEAPARRGPWLEDAEEPRIYWPAAYWPQIQALVEFDAERRRLDLPTLTDTFMH